MSLVTGRDNVANRHAGHGFAKSLDLIHRAAHFVGALRRFWYKPCDGAAMARNHNGFATFNIAEQLRQVRFCF